jgi:hypothetical protein
MTKDRPLHQMGSHAEGGAVSCSISLSFATCSNGLVHAAGFLFLRYSCSFKWTLNGTAADLDSESYAAADGWEDADGFIWKNAK